MSQSFLYVISPKINDTVPVVKLGISKDPEKRLRQLQTGHDRELCLFHQEPVEASKARTFEGLLHRDINHLRSHGEWFHLSVEDAIAHVQFTLIEYDDSELTF